MKKHKLKELENDKIINSQRHNTKISINDSLIL